MSNRTSNVILSVVALVMLGLYVGAYYATVKPMFRPSTFPTTPDPDYFYWHSKNEVSGGEAFFAPIHWLDRHLRPGIWKREI